MDWLLMTEPHHTLVTALVALTVMWLVRRHVTRPKNLPPGPSGLPFLGVAWTMYRTEPNPLRLFTSWAEKYGDIMTFNVGPMQTVVLSSYEAIREAFRHPDLNNRQPNLFLDEVIGEANTGIGFSSGDSWKEQRNFAQAVFRNLGVGKKSYEDTVVAEGSQLIAAFEEKKGSPFDPGRLTTLAVSNIICSVIFGTQYTYTDKTFQKMVNMLDTYMELVGSGGALLLLPIPHLSKFPVGRLKAITDCFKTMHRFTTDQIDSHKENLDPKNPRDFIDLYLNKMEESKGQSSRFHEINLRSSIADLFTGGTETTSTTLKWCMLHMMAYPKVQAKVQAEIDRVVGRGRVPRLDDRKDLPFTNAVLQEIQRKEVISPLGFPHVAAKDTQLRGYTIPKGATIVSNTWKVVRDPNLWENPNAFKPERFLTKDGELIKRDELIFFSVGRRQCPGEQLARMETFLFFTSLLQRFTFKKPDNSPPLSFDGVLGFTYSPKPFETCAVPRD